MRVSDCCGESPSFLSDDLCGGCEEWAEFNIEDDE